MPVINCWSGPRSLSTCFLYSFSQRTDCIAFDEPLYAHYLANNPNLFRPYREELMKSSETDGNQVIRNIYSSSTESKPLVYAKHIGKFLINIDRKPFYSDDSLHVILIRNPLDMIVSWNNKSEVHHEDCSLTGTSLPLLLELFSDIRQNTGRAPIIVDVEILQNNPELVLQELCKRLEIKFMPEQLCWPSGPKAGLDGIWAPFWYADVHNTTCFSSKSNLENNKIISNGLTQHQLDVYRECVPFYESLRRQAIGVSSFNPGSSLSFAFDPTTAVNMTMNSNRSLQEISNFTDLRNENILVWVGDRLLPRESAKVSVFDSSVQGGDAVWEGLRVYNGKIFSLSAHLRRLMDSAKILKFENIPNEKFIRYAIKNTLSANGMNDGVHIRLTLTRGPKISSSMNPKFNLFGCVLIVLPEWKSICGPTTYDNSKGISLVTSSIRRNSPQCLDSKIHHCNLINNILAKIDANNGSAADAVMLDCDGFVAETNATNLFCVKNQILYTPSADYCLPGCTRDVVINIAKSNNIVCVEKRLSISEFYTADEVFTTGTMGEITPVKSIDKRDISGPFNLTKQLQSLLLIQTANFSENII